MKPIYATCCFILPALWCQQPSLAQQQMMPKDGKLPKIMHDSSFKTIAPSQDGLAALVPALLAEVLMIPDLTVDQRTKVTKLYMEYRPRSLRRWQALKNLNPGGTNTATVGSEILAGLVISSGDDEKKQKDKQEKRAQMDASSARLKRELYMGMMRDHLKFCKEVLSILTKEQRVKLRAMSKPLGAPDYFIKTRLDMEKIGMNWDE